ncbi:MAG: ribose 5-phosphate isomerase B [Bacteriovoracaceae bacterium]|jgi:ribose 5-phosphate isomerase B|nr:ribose 5-phosphate isomerase B [Bacteriovoracaceae bacterium]
MQKLYIACDHAAFEMKEKLIPFLKESFEVEDLGTNSLDSVHYPDFGSKLAHAVKDNNALGIALCGSGIGISISVNRLKGIRGALCRSVDDAKMCKLHNNANIICFGARSNSLEEVKQMINTWKSTQFEGGRHQMRIDLLDK